MSPKTRKYLIDLGERAGWTLAECAVAFAGTEIANVPPAYAVPAAAVLALAKGLVARHIGSDATAATLPADADTPKPETAVKATAASVQQHHDPEHPRSDIP